MAISKELLEEINKYAKLAKERELTEEENKARQAARKEYLAEFKAGFKQVLDNVDVLKEVTVARSYEEVHGTLNTVDGITEITEIGFNLTKVTYNIKHHDANSILSNFGSK